MDCVYLQFNFKKKLTKQQEEILISLIKYNILEDMKDEIKRVRKFAPQNVKTFLDSMLAEVNGKPYFYKYYSLTKDDEKSYLFKGLNFDSIAGIDKVVKRIPILPKILRESRMYEKYFDLNFKNEMKLKDGEFDIIRIDKF